MRPLAVSLVLLASPAMAQPVEVPSGQPVEFYEVIRDVRGARGLAWRFRFVAPEIARNSGSINFETAARDMDHLCERFAIPRLPLMGPRPREVVISFSDRPLEFGEANPEITQFFEAYRIEDETCVWEGL